MNIGELTGTTVEEDGEEYLYTHGGEKVHLRTGDLINTEDGSIAEPRKYAVSEEVIIAETDEAHDDDTDDDADEAPAKKRRRK